MKSVKFVAKIAISQVASTLKLYNTILAPLKVKRKHIRVQIYRQFLHFFIFHFEFTVLINTNMLDSVNYPRPKGHGLVTYTSKYIQASKKISFLCLYPSSFFA